MRTLLTFAALTLVAALGSGCGSDSDSGGPQQRTEPTEPPPPAPDPRLPPPGGGIMRMFEVVPPPAANALGPGEVFAPRLKIPLRCDAPITCEPVGGSRRE